MNVRKVAIIGSRTYDKPTYEKVLKLVFNYIKSLDKERTILVSGGCASGADKACRDVCATLGYRYVESPAFWYRPGRNMSRTVDRSAGPFRNKTIEMISDECVAFWDGHSPGTNGTINLFKQSGKPVKVIVP